MGVGQFCTNPGVVILTAGAEADAFADAAAAALEETGAQAMLTAAPPRAIAAGVDTADQERRARS